MENSYKPFVNADDFVLALERAATNNTEERFDIPGDGPELSIYELGRCSFAVDVLQDFGHNVVFVTLPHNGGKVIIRDLIIDDVIIVYNSTIYDEGATLLLKKWKPKRKEGNPIGTAQD